MSIGVQMVVCIALGTAVGVWADRHIPGEMPWGTLVGFGLGAAAAFRELMRLADRPRPNRPRPPER
ncbi:MAG TPA: AtpZ/AtpI family protein [Armatimonadota bacterium]|nr:AtpZ/AtpI family protein [Armatimonadota bacterium]